MQGKRLIDSQRLLSKRSHKRESREQKPACRGPEDFPEGEARKQLGASPIPALQGCRFRQKTCCSKACFKKQNMQYLMVFFQPISLEKLRPEQPAELKGHFWSARGGGPRL